MRPTVVVCLASLLVPAALGAEVERLVASECVDLSALAGLHDDQVEDLSAAALTADGRFLLVASDEARDDERSEVHVFRADGRSFAHLETVRLSRGEADFEGLARHGDDALFFAVGSHSWRRKRVDGRQARKPYAELKERFEEESPDREADRERLVRFELDPVSGRVRPETIADLPLAMSLYGHRVLRHFHDLPSKEGGIDIEGIASDGERLYVGLRGPVLRHNLVPVVVASPDDLDAAELRYVKLEGRGVRDLARVGDGFLILAGPMGDAPLPYQLYFWDGHDAFPGQRGPGDPPAGRVELLGALVTPEEGKAEALVVLEESAPATWKLLILHDGLAGGAPECWQARRGAGP